MSVFAKITAAFFILVGLVLVVLGLISAGGSLLEAARPALPGVAPRGLSAIITGSALGFVMLFQGFLVVALGQVLWLLADIAAAVRPPREY